MHRQSPRSVSKPCFLFDVDLIVVSVGNGMLLRPFVNDYYPVLYCEGGVDNM
jgi:hypothetical protein